MLQCQFKVNSYFLKQHHFLRNRDPFHLNRINPMMKFSNKTLNNMWQLNSAGIVLQLDKELINKQNKLVLRRVTSESNRTYE